ncbi:PadR family transcriptional regulator [Streptomyces aureocirculatus]|uniref:PadR family transcriptional regulator n=1 Tax=Streptomyces aureocirculatus TaxID=67275 RepID=UPI001331C19B|nr:PadR family transcriptional regulator [Streptomyces aureocirculatus]
MLGLLEQSGSATPYALDREIQESVGHFWDFPRSQIYAEAARLVRHGLVLEEREGSGRRRRRLSITQAGRDVLAQWLNGPADHGTQIRDEGLLRLFFQQDGSSGAGQVRQLAAQQREAHRRKLAEYEAILASAPGPGGPAADAVGLGLRFEAPQAAALAYGLRFEQLAIAFWTEIVEHGADAVDPRSLAAPTVRDVCPEGDKSADD